jgi:hypothetical protein
VLGRHEVQFVVIGGYVAVLAGVEIVTRDVDITPSHRRRESRATCCNAERAARGAILSVPALEGRSSYVALVGSG